MIVIITVRHGQFVVDRDYWTKFTAFVIVSNLCAANPKWKIGGTIPMSLHLGGHDTFSRAACRAYKSLERAFNATVQDEVPEATHPQEVTPSSDKTIIYLCDIAFQKGASWQRLQNKLFRTINKSISPHWAYSNIHSPNITNLHAIDPSLQGRECVELIRAKIGTPDSESQFEHAYCTSKIIIWSEHEMIT